jgi:hypothetical protein
MTAGSDRGDCDPSSVMDFSFEQRYEIDGRRVSREKWLGSLCDEVVQLQAETFEEIKAEVEALSSAIAWDAL